MSKQIRLNKVARDSIAIIESLTGVPVQVKARGAKRVFTISNRVGCLLFTAFSTQELSVWAAGLSVGSTING